MRDEVRVVQYGERLLIPPSGMQEFREKQFGVGDVRVVRPVREPGPSDFLRQGSGQRPPTDARQPFQLKQ